MNISNTQITNFSFLQFSTVHRLIFFILCLFTFSTYSTAQCSLTCNDNVQVSLDENCYAEITPDDILEGTYDPACEPFTVVVLATGTNYVTGNQIGQTLDVTVTANGGNSCTGTIVVSDYIAPVINCNTVTITCLDDPDDVAAPSVTDNCDGSPALTVTEDINDLGCGGLYYQVITRTYTATDASGNISSCDQIINVTRPGLNQVVFPQHLDDIQLPALDCVNPNSNPSNTGEPTINDQSIDNVCDFNVSYTDQFFPICQNSTKIQREWNVLDWCTNQSITYTQTIKILDKTAPTIVCPGDQTVSTANDDCFGSIILPQANVSDDCSSTNNITVQTTASNGNMSGNLLYNLPVGITTVTYTATDDCGNTASCTMTILVEDDVAPVVACETNHVVGLSTSTPTLVQAETFDDGSYDLCGSVSFLARRMDAAHCPGNDGSQFSAYVPFYCCDVGNTVMVELQVTDNEGNSNSCMVETTVEDQVNPTISCPANVTLDCSEDYNDLNLTGEALATDNCSATLSYVDFENTNNCGGGTVTRTWTATDDSGNTASCVQQINFVNASPFFITDIDCNNSNPNDGVIWPCDYDTDSCGPGLDPETTGEPEIFEDFCDLVAVTYEDTYLPITPPACVKVIRNWTVVDWCQYDQNTGDGLWEYTQIIKVLNSADPTILTDCNTKAFCSYDEDCLEGPVELILTANDDCTDSLDLNYNYWIDLDDDDSVDITGESNDASNDYPLGTHSILWHVEDGCGNVSICEYQFIISDCKKPTPYAYNGLAIEIDPNTCLVELWAVDFNNGSYDNCEIAEYRINSPSQGPGQTTPPPAGANSVIFTPDDLGTQTVDFWVGDINGNWDYVSTYVLVQDNSLCSDVPHASISGFIETEESSALANVTVHLDGTNAPGIPDFTITNDAGQYAFPFLPLGGNYAVEPEKDNDPLNGVTVLDILLINKHILQIETLDSPYKMIAADVNKSGSISAIDLVQLKKLILAIDSTFQNNKSWRFVEADFVFPNEENPFETSFPEIYTVNGLEWNETADFTAMKIGDVNGSASTSDLSDEAEDRAAGKLIFGMEDQQLKAGETYKIPFKSLDFKDISAFQFSLNFDQQAIEFKDILYPNLNNLNHDNFGFAHLDKGTITSAWHEINGLSLDKHQAVFSIRFKALKNQKLREVFDINSSITPAIAYSSAGKAMSVNLAFSDSSDKLILFQNCPNPFENQTTISFQLPKAQQASLSIYDVSGKLLKTVEQEFNQGYNEVSIDINELNASGVMYYQIKTEAETQTRIMVHTGSKN